MEALIPASNFSRQGMGEGRDFLESRLA